MRGFVLCLILLNPFLSHSQYAEQPDAASIQQRLKKLNFLGSVLYMAAHPDDENTRIISLLSKGRLATTGYLSLTRGDGGQNLIGAEIRDELGVIRTQELLAARRIDGGEQFFTRAIDFGFSKSAEEAFDIWGKDSVLSDVVKVFREYQPDVIITRFPPDERAGHGHHTASAILAHEAFDLAGNGQAYPDQLISLGPWKPIRLYTNTGRWWNKDINEKTPGVLTLNVGEYNALLGKSYTEIAAKSSSQHRSQGWGTAPNRGYQAEFLEYQKGEKATDDIFEGINTSWSRLDGGDIVGMLVTKTIDEFKINNPSASIPSLIEIRKAIAKLPDSVWKRRKLAEVDQLLLDCSGLFLEAVSGNFQGVAGDQINLTMDLLNRSNEEITVSKITVPNLAWDTTATLDLNYNEKVSFKIKKALLKDLPNTEPYWLRAEHALGLFDVRDESNIGLAENPPSLKATFTVHINGETIDFERPIIYKWTDRVKGELWRPFTVVPDLFVNASESVMIFSNQPSKQLNVVLRSNASRTLTGSLKLILPSGWKSAPETSAFEMQREGDEIIRTFEIIPPDNQSVGNVMVIAEIDNEVFSESVKYIMYDHIPTQTLMPRAEVQVVKLDMKKAGNLVAYIDGAGDEIPAALRSIGYEVWQMKNEEITLENLRKADAVIFGIRALNTNTRLRYFMSDVLTYAKQGGTVIMQYNTSNGLQLDNFSPFPLTLGRDRVTDENAEVRILKPDHPVFNYPNKITTEDFNGWVQERGLYFPSTWGKEFETLLSMNDPKESSKEGSLLIAPYGDGYFIYTGLSFFRQLPAGVPGAYKLFANLVSLDQTPKTESELPKSKSRSKGK
ncbi:MAG TPA: PIG-L family deacetylase [Chryseosolibacter sp.]|nr:PIG-L family deacetylase [Chryseosolibacter sp.]